MTQKRMPISQVELIAARLTGQLPDYNDPVTVSPMCMNCKKWKERGNSGTGVCSDVRARGESLMGGIWDKIEFANKHTGKEDKGRFITGANSHYGDCKHHIFK